MTIPEKIRKALAVVAFADYHVTEEEVDIYLNNASNTAVEEYIDKVMCSGDKGVYQTLSDEDIFHDYIVYLKQTKEEDY